MIPLAYRLQKRTLPITYEIILSFGRLQVTFVFFVDIFRILYFFETLFYFLIKSGTYS